MLYAYVIIGALNAVHDNTAHNKLLLCMSDTCIAETIAHPFKVVFLLRKAMWTYFMGSTATVGCDQPLSL